jgi:hypothetical protein
LENPAGHHHVARSSGVVQACLTLARVKGSIRDVVKVGEGIRDIELSDRKMLHDERIAESVIIGATSSLEIECPLLDTALRTILTECHIVSSTRLVETQSLYEFFLIYGIRNLEGIVFCRRDDRF